MNTYLIVLFIVLVIIIGLFCFQIFKKYKNLKYKYEIYWPVQHRLDKDGNLQYSVDGKLWTYIIGYVEKFNYGTGYGPALSYIQFKSDEEYEYESWCNMLYSMQKCHEFNKKALDLYIGKIKEYLKDKPEDK
jgi:hypothetical protein